jgi:copper(I)-binding protein
LNGLARIPLNNQGGTDRWESLYLIKGVSSMAEAFEGINQTLMTEGKWTRQPDASANDMTSFWKFTDEGGKQWNGAVNIQPAIGDKDRFLVSLKIACGDAKMEANANPADPNQIIIKDAWIQEGPPSQKVAAAFLVIENQGAADIALLSAKADVAGAVELHKMEAAGEVMKMRRLDLIPVPAGGRAELQPAGLHLMLVGLSKPIRQGDEVSVTLQFSNSAQKTFRVPVRKRDAAAN